jgi:hypothetical protein
VFLVDVGDGQGGEGGAGEGEDQWGGGPGGQDGDQEGGDACCEDEGDSLAEGSGVVSDYLGWEAFVAVADDHSPAVVCFQAGDSAEDREDGEPVRYQRSAQLQDDEQAGLGDEDEREAGGGEDLYADQVQA